MLVVTQPTTPGQSSLGGTIEEEHRVRESLEGAHKECETLDDKQATVIAVRASMDLHLHHWVHLACHGSRHTGEATQSDLYLEDGPPSLSDLMQIVADDAELAFLSAGQTTAGDEKNPEESVHQAAGMIVVGLKGVVATMWSIKDADVPIVVDAYYRKLLESRRTGAGEGKTGAAYALHQAVKVLRDHVGERSFFSWAPFVHSTSWTHVWALLELFTYRFIGIVSVFMLAAELVM